MAQPECCAKLLSGMKKGTEYIIIKNDHLIRKLAVKLLKRACHGIHQQNYIRSRLRKLARLVIHIRPSNASLKNADLKTANTGNCSQAVARRRRDSACRLKSCRSTRTGCCCIFYDAHTRASHDQIVVPHCLCRQIAENQHRGLNVGHLGHHPDQPSWLP